MARQPVDRGTAASVVQESLGLSAEDLGMDRDNAFEGLEFDEEGNEDDNDELDAGDEDTSVRHQDADDDDELGDDFQQPQRRQKDDKQKQPDPRVTHTRKDQDEPVAQKIKYDGKGNIVGPDGKTVVAKAGREARFYTSMHKARGMLGQVQQQARTEINRLDGNLKKAVEIGTGLAQQLTQLREAGTEHTRMGLTDQDHREALELASMFKRSPVDAVKTILTRATARGIDLSTLGLQPGGFDPKALLDLVRAEMGTATKPILERNQRETAQQTADRERQEGIDAASQEFSKFLIDNPEANEFIPVFEKIYSDPRYVNMTLNEVWLRIQLNLARGQREPQARNRDPQAQRLRNRQAPRLPNGRQTPPNGRRERQQVDDDLAPVSMTYEDILRGVMGPK